MSTGLTRSTSLLLKGPCQAVKFRRCLQSANYNKSVCDFMSSFLHILLNALHFYEIAHWLNM